MATFAVLRHQLHRALRDPTRLAKVHYSSVLASLRSVAEPDERRFVCEYFGIDLPAFRRLEADLLEDTDFLRCLGIRHHNVRGTSIRVLGAVSAEDHDRGLRLLYYCTRLERPEIVVETGVFDGLSSAFILKALRDNAHGRLCSIDLPARTPVRASTDKMRYATLPAGAEPGWIVPDALRARWTLRLGASRAVLAPWLDELGRIDMFFHDSLHTSANMAWEYAVAWRALAPGGLLISDDVFWNGAFWRFSREMQARRRIIRGIGFLRKGSKRAPPSAGAPDRPAVSIIVPIAPGRSPLVLDSFRDLDTRAAYCRLVTRVGPNPSRNRNQTIAGERASILAFTDDDCQLAPDWLARALAFFREHPDYDVVGGPQLNRENEGMIARASGYALASWFGTFRLRQRFRRARPRLAATQFDLTSANLFITKRAFDAWGPFDERLWPNEETALLRRIEQAGGKIAYDPGIVVFHKRRDSLRGLASQCFGYGRGRARQARIEGTRPAAEQTVPALFLLYLILLPVLAPRWPATLAPLALYGVIGLLVSAASAVTRADVRAGLAMPFAFLAIHLAYPAGYLLEAARLLLADPDMAASGDLLSTGAPITERNATAPALAAEHLSMHGPATRAPR